MPTSDPPTETLTKKLQSSDDAPRKVQVEQPFREGTTHDDDGDRARYVRKRLLGSGGMGQVVLAVDPAIGRDIALKEMNTESLSDEAARARFECEARLQGQLEHPAIVPVYELGTDEEGHPYFTMKRVRGQSLAEVLRMKRDGDPTRFSMRKLLTAFSQLCSAAHFAHERGVVHRDIKPANIMLGSYGEVYLLDWGVAKVLGSESQLASERPKSDPAIERSLASVLTARGSVVGTISTLSPEQAVGGVVDARSDVYSLGAVLFEILTLEPLHPKGTYEQVLGAILAGVDARPNVRVPTADVPPELADLCVAATRLHPSDRLASAELLQDGIERYLDGDRDLELRRTGARSHAATARTATERLMREESGALRTTALREVGKALALDAENKDALGTLVQLLTTPPKVVPPQVVAEQDAESKRHMRTGGAAAALLYAYIVFNGVAFWQLGVQDKTTFLLLHALWFVAFLAGVVTYLRPSYHTLFATFLLGLTTSAFATIFDGPYLVVPTLITMHAVLYALVKLRSLRFVMIGLSCVAWSASVFGERWGLFPRMIGFIDQDMIIHSPVMMMPETGTTIYLWGVVLAALIGPPLVIGAIRSRSFITDEKLRLQAWQLRQLVSDDSAVSGQTGVVEGRP
jgi:eukaryotic-like serine/threonine-protein kinase